MITAKPVEPTLDRRDSEIFDRTLFSRDDQVLHLLSAGINAGQQEGGGKSRKSGGLVSTWITAVLTGD